MDNNKNSYLPTDSNFDINNFPFYWIARLDALYAQEMDKTLKKIGMDIARWRVCMLLKVHKKLHVSEIAQHAVSKIPTMTKIVQRMEAEGLVTAHKEKTDARIKVISLTEEGYKKIAIVLTTTKPLFKDAFEGLSNEEVFQLNISISKILNNLNTNNSHLK